MKMAFPTKMKKFSNSSGSFNFQQRNICRYNVPTLRPNSVHTPCRSILNWISTESVYKQ